MSKPLSSGKSETENGCGPRSNRIADVSIVAPHPSYALGFVASMSVSRQARSTGDLRGPNIHSASSRRTHHDSAFESAPVTHTACLRHVHYTGSDSFP